MPVLVLLLFVVTTYNCAFFLIFLYFSLFYAYRIMIYMQEKYEEAMASLAQMENRAVMAETMLEATLQYQSSQQKALSPCPSPRYLSYLVSIFCKMDSSLK